MPVGQWSAHSTATPHLNDGVKRCFNRGVFKRGGAACKRGGAATDQQPSDRDDVPDADADPSDQAVAEVRDRQRMHPDPDPRHLRRRRDFCHLADALSQFMLKHLMKLERGCSRMAVSISTPATARPVPQAAAPASVAFRGPAASIHLPKSAALSPGAPN